MNSAALQLTEIKQLFVENKLQQILSILESNPSLDILSLSDKKQLTLLHQSILQLKDDAVKFIVQYARTYIISDSDKQARLLSWLDSPTIEGFTALHYASFKGSVEILELLVESGVNIDARNTKGLSALHIAAQGDQPISLAYFYSIGYSLDIKEMKGSTALHWASYLGSENALSFLISKSNLSQINLADSEGLTPLHLSVISGNARVVKKLLLKGADREIVDGKGKTASTLAQENEFFNIKSMVDDTGGLAEFCNIKQPFKPQQKGIKQLVVFAILLLLSQSTIIAFIAPTVGSNFVVEGSVWVSVNFVSVITLLLAWLNSPGRVAGIKKSYVTEQCFNTITGKSSTQQQSTVNKKKATIQKEQRMNSLNRHFLKSNINASSNVGDDPLMATDSLRQTPLHSQQQQMSCEEYEWVGQLIRLYKKTGDDSRICVECCIVKPKRSRHCEVCKMCVRVYDHHCPWINNCVGAANHGFFMVFILSIWTEILTTIVLIAMHLTDDYVGSGNDGQDSTMHCNWYSGYSEDERDTLKIIKFIVCAIILAVAALFFVMHSALCAVQLKNFFLNKTTFERHNAKKKIPVERDEEEEILQQEEQQKLQQHQQSVEGADGRGGGGAGASQNLNDFNVSDFNPSLIESNSKGFSERNSQSESVQQQQRLREQKKNESNCGCSNFRTMCCRNATDASFGYDPEMEK